MQLALVVAASISPNPKNHATNDYQTNVYLAEAVVQDV